MCFDFVFIALMCIVLMTETVKKDFKIIFLRNCKTCSTFIAFSMGAGQMNLLFVLNN